MFLQIHKMVIVSTNLIKPFHLNHGLGFPGSPKRYFLALLKAPGIARCRTLSIAHIASPLHSGIAMIHLPEISEM